MNVKWIKKIQNRSDSEKNKIALILSFFITVVIVLLWVFLNPLLLDQKNDQADSNQSSQVAEENESKGIFSFFGDILDVLNPKKNIDNSD